MHTRSTLGFTLAGIYIALCIYLIATQGLFGESFIALILGMPWSMVFAYFEFGNASGIMLYAFVLAPIALNALVLYWIGFMIHRVFRGAA